VLTRRHLGERDLPLSATICDRLPYLFLPFKEQHFVVWLSRAGNLNVQGGKPGAIWWRGNPRRDQPLLAARRLPGLARLWRSSSDGTGSIGTTRRPLRLPARRLLSLIGPQEQIAGAVRGIGAERADVPRVDGDWLPGPGRADRWLAIARGLQERTATLALSRSFRH
jgi:hypothetical protein